MQMSECLIVCEITKQFCFTETVTDSDSVSDTETERLYALWNTMAESGEMHSEYEQANQIENYYVRYI